MPDYIFNDEDNLRKLYLEQMRTDKEIAKMYGCHKQTVFETRKRFGIKSLKRWQRNICNPTEEQSQIICGTLLGDSSISWDYRDKYLRQSQLRCSHGLKQKDYLFWKYEKLKNLCFSKQDNDKLVTHLRKSFGIQSYIRVYSTYPVIVVDKDSRRKFVDIVKPYIVPCLMYKTRLKGKRYGKQT